MFWWGSLASQFTPTRLEFRIHNVSQAAPKGSRQNDVVSATNPLRSIGFPTWGCSPKTLEGFHPHDYLLSASLRPGYRGRLRSASFGNLLWTNEPCSLDSCVRRPASRHLSFYPLIEEGGEYALSSYL